MDYGGKKNPVEHNAVYFRRKLKEAGSLFMGVTTPPWFRCVVVYAHQVAFTHREMKKRGAIAAMCEVGAMISVRYPTLPDPVQEIQDDELSEDKNPTEFDECFINCLFYFISFE
ncbi:hypothetical protein Ocin01_14433 [Orchesella cincta]|uniref:Uncharacterized protein n=1 Tax=Orchesella cincta TaxID=48709 RepID=A0A1D2MGX3_ORCCI|nr:hypothetical protein Ocin01_14433 [Orchesella cincta]